MIERLRYVAYVAGWALVRAMPERLAAALFRWGADLAWRRQGKGARRLASNLRRVLGPGATEAEVQRVARAGLRSYARYWMEVFRLPVLGRARIVGRTRCIDEHRLRDAAASGRGAIVALPHQGNWDHAGAWAVLTGLRLTTVAERLRPEELFDRFLEFRVGLGMEVIPLTGGAAAPFTVLTERLRAGGLVCLLADRDLTARGVPVEFFGEQARFPGGPAALALRSGATLLPATLWFSDGGWVIRIHEPVPHTTIAGMTQALARVFEEGIAAHPEDWHMLQRLWVADLDADRAPAGSAAGSPAGSVAGPPAGSAAGSAAGPATGPPDGS